MTDETPKHRRRKPRGTEPRPARKRYANRGSLRGRVHNPGLADADDGNLEVDPEAALGGDFDPAASAELDRRDSDADPEGV